MIHLIRLIHLIHLAHLIHPILPIHHPKWAAVLFKEVPFFTNIFYLNGPVVAN
jgi:hypothetical protein